MGTMNFEKFSI